MGWNRLSFTILSTFKQNDNKKKDTQWDKITTQAKSEKSIEQDKTKDKDNKNNVQGNIKKE